MFVALFDVHHGEVALAERPQGLTSAGSVATAVPGVSATRFVTLKIFEPAEPACRAALADVAATIAAAREDADRYQPFA